MALMKHREPNHVLWRGARPGHNGTQICKAGSVGGGGTDALYTVDDGEVLFITYVTLSSSEDTAAAGTCSLRTTPIGEVGLVRIMDHEYAVAGHQVSTATFNPPIEVAETVQVQLNSSHANIIGRACIHGWIQAV